MRVSPFPPLCCRAVLFLAFCLPPSASLLSDLSAGGRRTHTIAAALIPRLVLLIHAANFASVGVQAGGLVGPRGVVPVRKTLLEMEDNLSFRERRGILTPVASRVAARLTALVWRRVFGEDNVIPAAWGGCVLSAGLALAPSVAGGRTASALAFVSLYLYWYAYKRVLGTFANFQWDMLLLECTVLCALLSAASSPMAVASAVHLVRACVLRLHCGAGVAKLGSGDEHWTSLTAMAVHHETQPLPTALAPALHSLPMWFHRASTLAALTLEIGTAVAYVPLPFSGEAAFLMVAAVQSAIVASGNYGFFNALSAILGISFLHDTSPLIERLRPHLLPLSSDVPVGTLTSSIVDASVLLASAPLALLYLFRAADYASAYGEGLLPPFATRWLRSASSTFFLANRYSLFSNMTVPRREIVLEATEDGTEWMDLDFKYKPGRLGTGEGGIRFVPPFHMPRLDWRLWIMAQQVRLTGGGRRQKLLGRSVSFTATSPAWFEELLQGIVDGRLEILALLGWSASGPDQGAFLAVRGRLYIYSFSDCGGTSSGAWARTSPEGSLSFYGGKVVRSTWSQSFAAF